LLIDSLLDQAEPSIHHAVAVGEAVDNRHKDIFEVEKDFVLVQTHQVGQFEEFLGTRVFLAKNDDFADCFILFFEEFV